MYNEFLFLCLFVYLHKNLNQTDSSILRLKAKFKYTLILTDNQFQFLNGSIKSLIFF